MLKTALIALLAASVVVPLAAQAQMRGSISMAGGSWGGASISARGFHGGFPGRSGMPHSYPASVLLGYPYFGDFGDFNAAPVTTETQPQVVIVQMPPAATPQITPATPPEALILELRGDQYVQVSGPKAGQEEAVASLPQDKTAARKNLRAREEKIQPQPPAAEQPPVTLIYRDGRREQVRQYTIADGILYALGNYYRDGYWSKKIQLSELNLPATETASQAYGAAFVLPNSPNEIVTRP